MKDVMGMGTNRTGLGTSPIDAKAIVESAEEGVPVAPGDGAELAALRGDYVRSAEPIGTVPPPTTVKGAATSAVQMLTGKQPVVLLDKLSARLAFERTGTRLYEALLAKMSVAKVPAPVSIADVRRFHDEERAHFAMVDRAIERLGGDPTAQTPAADIEGVASMGLLQVISDPRTSVLQSLHALHIAELADNDSWELLVDLTTRMGQTEMAAEFQLALKEEAEHLATLRRWLSTAALQEAGVAASGA
ncbi:ferritin-like domain-containing protein [Pendulispora albinea]|uniref:Ferritin-like domain-containing protein n=1 Tax=Pendulispora albinea TaxID=2741071 RepID=A0ABZ2LRP0_9BACT